MMTLLNKIFPDRIGTFLTLYYMLSLSIYKVISAVIVLCLGFISGAFLVWSIKTLGFSTEIPLTIIQMTTLSIGVFVFLKNIENPINLLFYFIIVTLIATLGYLITDDLDKSLLIGMFSYTLFFMENLFLKR